MKFPSPCGDYGSYHIVNDGLYSKMALFPSPCGDYGSYLEPEVEAMSFFEDSFRPLAGIMVLIRCSPLRWLHLTIGFRPLAGIMVLINKESEENIMKFTKVSVPLRGLWFLSPIDGGQ